MKKLIVSPSPHILSRNTTADIMLDVVLALFPALFAGIYFFGPRALIVTLVCVVSCVVFEYLVRKIMKKDNTIRDFSAVVTGMLLAFNLPPAIPLWVAVIGCFFAIVVVKQMFGGDRPELRQSCNRGKNYALCLVRLVHVHLDKAIGLSVRCGYDCFGDSCLPGMSILSIQRISFLEMLPAVLARLVRPHFFLVGFIW